MNRRNQNPKLRDFYHDMNRHSAAHYRHPAPDIVLELDSRPGSGWRLLAWEAVSRAHVDEYVPPENPDNRYAWDAIGEATFEDRSEALSELEALTTENKAREWAAENEYTGPRRPYSDRNPTVNTA